MFDIEFNPKENFLKEQLEVSGLEMKFFQQAYEAAFSGQINKRGLPVSKFDYKLDAVVTEKDIFVF